MRTWNPIESGRPKLEKPVLVKNREGSVGVAKLVEWADSTTTWVDPNTGYNVEWAFDHSPPTHWSEIESD